MTTQTRRIRRSGSRSDGWQDHWRPGPPTTLDVILGLSNLPPERGNCYGMAEGMFPKGDSVAEQQALAICKGCPIQLDCLRMGLDQSEQLGVWGGMSAAKRRAMKAMLAA